MTYGHTAARDRAAMDADPHRVLIRVRGCAPAGAVERLGLEVRQAPRHTVLRGAVADRSALHGVLERLRLDGLELVDVRRLR
jgi:hypothetical protein